MRETGKEGNTPRDGTEGHGEEAETRPEDGRERTAVPAKTSKKDISDIFSPHIP